MERRALAGDRGGTQTLRYGCWLAVMAGLVGVTGAVAQAPVEVASALPDAPSVVSRLEMPAGQTADQEQPRTVPMCERMSWGFKEKPVDGSKGPCKEDPVQNIVGSETVEPLSSKQKAELAGRSLVSPFNLLTITGYSAVYVAANSHSPYGPGYAGFGRLVGYSFAEDTQGEFFGTYAIPSLAHEDPRYHRMPGKPVGLRILHALSHTVLTRHDDGTLMPNYATLLTYPISDALSDAYVPGIDTGAAAYRDRVLLGYATDPAGALIAEFLPDVAKRIHVRVVFVQQILNQVVANKSNNQ